MKRKIDDIFITLREMLPELKNKYKISSLEIFGSALRDDFSDQSDIDILVKFDEPPTLLKFLELENYLSDLLSMRIDLVMRDSLKPGLKEQILSETELV